MEEKVVIVDNNNKIVDVVPRSVMRSKGLQHRSTYIIINNSKGQVLVQKRSADKDLYPEYYDPTTGGVVVENETYEENAVRELEEELGIKGAQLQTHFDYQFEDGPVRVWGRVFSTTYDGPIELVDGEVDAYCFIHPNDLEQFFDGKLVMPDGKMAYDKYLQEISNKR